MSRYFNNNSLTFNAKLAVIFVAMATLFVFSFGGRASGQDSQNKAEQKRLDPKDWGGNHVSKPLPNYVQGDECLFCHRYGVGATWQKNAHALTVRQREDAPEMVKILEAQPSLASITKQVEFFMGSRHRVRFLKKEGYGKFAILNAQAVLGESGQATKIIDGDKLVWDKDKFANRCAGCHATGINAADKTFTAFGIDCYVCHGDVNVDHSNDTSLILLSKKRRNGAKLITSLCAQCHLRGSRSRSTGLPYPNNFVAGDNLFQDLEVDWSKADDEKMGPGERHIWLNVRDVALYGNEAITCLSCHQIHGNSSLKHRRILRVAICSECHESEGFKNVKRFSVHSELCEY
ncbi:MAG TPA: multiheme c-type cytochrome [Blastocatellia bacterium]|nr:multiheme c-type cytochrome [Blastocatellia bacterium]